MIVSLLILASEVAASGFPGSQAWSSFESNIFKGELGAERLRVLKGIVLVVFILLIAVSIIWASMTLGWIRGRNASSSNKAESAAFIPDKQSFDAETSKAIHDALRKYGSQRGSSWRSSTNWQ
jgi:hypothetical protein